MQTILEQAKALAPEIISWRHQIHMQPEVGLDLPKTVALVTEELKKMGYEAPGVRRRRWTPSWTAESLAKPFC